MIIGIIGLGLIGGSLGMDFRSQGHFVWGISRRESTCAHACAIGAIDQSFTHWSDIPSPTDIIFICTPLGDIIPTLEHLVRSAALLPTTIVTDVGSVKASIVSQAVTLWANFIGSHPMAGNASSGISAAQKNLFQNCPCAITTPPENKNGEVLTGLWQSIGMQTYYCDAEEHDRAVAWISHLPVVISAALTLACEQEGIPNVKHLSRLLASSGFRDTSRVGGGNPELGRWMAETNRSALLHSLNTYQAVLEHLKHTIELNQWDTLESVLGQAQTWRQNYLKP